MILARQSHVFLCNFCKIDLAVSLWQNTHHTICDITGKIPSLFPGLVDLGYLNITFSWKSCSLVCLVSMKLQPVHCFFYFSSSSCFIFSVTVCKSRHQGIADTILWNSASTILLVGCCKFKGSMRIILNFCFSLTFC